MKHTIKRAIKILISEGLLTFLYKLNIKIKSLSSTETQYNQWIKDNEKDNMKINRLEYNPVISVIVPVYNVLDTQLIECIESVRNQTYKYWELCLVDDASTWKNVRNTLKRYENISNIKIKYRVENGHISKTTNDGIDMATGEFIAFLDCDDVLTPNALYEMAKKLNENTKYDFIYSDEDKITEDGKNRHSPFFKPEWSPDTLMSLMYTSHFSIYRRSIVNAIGGIRIGYEGAQDYDFTLRFTEKTNNIGHIPKILYHWRERAESTALSPLSKPYIFEATKKAKEDALNRRGFNGELEFLSEINQYRVKYINEHTPKVSVIIPSKDNYLIFCECIKSIKKFTTYKNYEIIVIDNGSNENNKLLYTEFCRNNECIYHYEQMNFNFSKMCNIGAKIASGQFFIFLNDDIEIITKDWIDILVGHASLPHVGAVGAKLYYPNSNIIQHIGVTNLKIGPSHSLVFCKDDSQYYYGRNKIEYNYIAVTGACLMIEKAKYDKINGFEEELPIAYNDVELCFKLIENNYYNVVRNDVILYHHESISRGNDLVSAEKLERLHNELKRLYSMHPLFNGDDPFYSPNLTQHNIDYNINTTITPKHTKYKTITKELEVNTSNTIEFFIDSISVGTTIRIEGWAYNKKSLFTNLNIKNIILVNDQGEKIKIPTIPVYRPDVTSAFGNKKNLNFSGFYSSFDKEILRNNKYQIMLSYKDVFSLKDIIIDVGKVLMI
jgi:O-antigen biosynthesis protein